MKLSEKATERLSQHSWDIDVDYVLEKAREALERPSDASFFDEDLYKTHTLAFHTPDWSLTNEYIVGQANYRDALDILADLGAESATVGHWTYSRYECVKLPVLDSHGDIGECFVEFCALVKGLEDYPLINDETHSELESEVVDDSIKQAIADYEQNKYDGDPDMPAENTDPYFDAWQYLFELSYQHDPTDYYPDFDTIREAIEYADQREIVRLQESAGQVALDGTAS